MVRHALCRLWRDGTGLCNRIRDARHASDRSRRQRRSDRLSADRSARGGGALAAARDPMDQGRRRNSMIQPLRRAHLRIWVFLTVILYAVFVAGLLARRTATPPNPGLNWEQYR